MDYFLSFTEGIITFISPCLLPLLPVYISYFIGEEAGSKRDHKRKALINSCGFVLGFTLVFLLLGGAAATFGNFLKRHEIYFDLVGGAILILFGLNLIHAIQIGFLNRTRRLPVKINTFNFFKSVLFGLVFSIGWTPCVGPFLSSALLLAADSQQAGKGVVMLLLYSLGLGIPFILAAGLIDGLTHSFDFIKRHYSVFNLLSGLLLIIVGILMMSGRLGAYLSFLTLR